MEEIGGLFRLRDFVVFLLIVLTIIVSFDSPNLRFTLEPAWFIGLVPGVNDDVFFDRVPPLVTDLDGDGSNELIVITRDWQLDIYNAEPPMDSGEIYHPEVLNTLPLSSMKINEGRKPIALRAGYITPYIASESREQVIVVVREDWTVTCYDGDLTLLWERVLAHKSHEWEKTKVYFEPNDLSVYISSISITDASHGVVIVGGSMKLKDSSGTDFGADPDTEHANMELRSALEHFSMYALDGSTGKVLWRHDGLDVQTEQYSRSLPQHAYTLDLSDLMTKAHHAPGFNDWNMFRQSLIDELPHDWTGPQDASMRLAHFVRRHIGAGAESQIRKPHNKQTGKDKKAKSARRDSAHRSVGIMRYNEVATAPIAPTASMPHTAAEHLQNPNVLVAHTMNGVEVAALRTGAPITSLALSPHRTYADVDGDGVVDSVILLDSAETAAIHSNQYTSPLSKDRLQHCSLLVVSGLPPQSQLFNGSVCHEKMSLQESMSMHREGVTFDGTEFSPHLSKKLAAVVRPPPPKKVEFARPLVLPRIDPRTKKESAVKNIFVLVDTGMLTCYTGAGAHDWQVKNAPKWDIENDAHRSLTAIDTDAGRADELGTHQSGHAFILATSVNAVHLMSSTGELLAWANLPKPPITPPVVADFDNDGVTDVIIVSSYAILGYRVSIEQSTHGLTIALVILFVVAVVVFVASIQKVPEVFLDNNDDSGTAAGGGSASSNMRGGPKSRAVGILKIIRSTDEYHLD